MKRTELRRTPLRRTEWRRRTRATGPTSAVLCLVLRRAGHDCETCGRQLFGRRGEAWSIQHRMPRGRGGTGNPLLNRPPNLLVVCGSGTTGCHGRIERARQLAYDLGLLLHRCACWPPDCVHAPAEQPVWLLSQGWVLLTDDGRYLPCTAPEGAPEGTEPREVA